MSHYPIGTRVLAIRSATEDVVHSFGEGVYAGRWPKPGTTYAKTEAELSPEEITRSLAFVQAQEAAGVFESDAQWLRDHGASEQEIADYWAPITAARQTSPHQRAVAHALEMAAFIVSEPRIDLDNGGSVWGSQCWWGPVETLRRRFEGRAFVEVETP